MTKTIPKLYSKVETNILTILNNNLRMLIKMVKKTINFHNPKILEDFDKKIVSEHGSVRGNRTRVLEKLMSEYTSGEYTKNIEEIDKLKDKINEISSEHYTLLSLNETVTQENKKLSNDVHELNTNIESLQKEVDQLRLENQHLTKLLAERDERISEYQSTIIEDKNEIEKRDKKITKKENEYKHLEEIRNKDLKEKQELNNQISQYSYIIGYIENMSLIDRIRKNYPDEMKALPPITTKY